jgi:glycyl-tRNA synthetase beta chain
MLLKFNLEISIVEILKSCLALFGPVDQKLAGTIGEFIYGRLKQSLKDQTVDYDILEAVFAVNHSSFLTTAYLCKLFQSHRQEKWFVPLIDTAVRVNNILDPKITSEVDEKLFNMPEEKNVFAVLDKNIKAMQKGVMEKQTESVIGSLKNLVEPVGQFFEKVLVNDKDEKIKKNRMALVKKVSDFYRQVAAFEKIVVSK